MRALVSALLWRRYTIDPILCSGLAPLVMGGCFHSGSWVECYNAVWTFLVQYCQTFNAVFLLILLVPKLIFSPLNNFIKSSMSWKFTLFFPVQFQERPFLSQECAGSSTNLAWREVNNRSRDVSLWIRFWIFYCSPALTLNTDHQLLLRSFFWTI